MPLNVVKLFSWIISKKKNVTKDEAPYDYIKEDVENQDYNETSVKEINNNDNSNSKKNNN